MLPSSSLNTFIISAIESRMLPSVVSRKELDWMYSSAWGWASAAAIIRWGTFRSGYASSRIAPCAL